MGLLVSCSPSGSGSGEPQAKPDEGRKDTKAVRALDAVGYNSAPIRRNLDAALDRNEQRNKELDQATQGMDGK
jgi:hypothetical protein